MTNEATLIYELATPIPMTCSNTTGIERGAFLTLSDPLTAAAVSASNAAVAGIAAAEKIASDGCTKIPVYRQGIFKVTASGSVSVGECALFVTENKIEAAPVSGAQHIAGVCLEAATNGETLLFELKPTHRFGS
jgi:predicted RecA/RadA family phage recombinase